jgi:hypothetical protein
MTSGSPRDLNIKPKALSSTATLATCRSTSPRSQSADPVDTASWSKDGQLDWWGEGTVGMVGPGTRVRTVVSDGSMLLIFVVPRAGHSHDGSHEGARVGGASKSVLAPPGLGSASVSVR